MTSVGLAVKGAEESVGSLTQAVSIFLHKLKMHLVQLTAEP